MGASEFPSANTEGMSGIVTAQIQANRARIVVVRNSRIYVGAVFLTSIAAAFIGICAALMALSLVFPINAFTVARAISAAQWGFTGVFLALMCPFLWSLARRMAHYSVRLDSSGVQFHLGTKPAQGELFLPWDQIIAIQQQRVGNSMQFTVKAADGAYAQYSSYTFLRPKRVARLIAERTGLAIQKI